MHTVHFNFKQILIILAIVSLTLVSSAIFTSPAMAANGINRTINFQGRLVRNDAGNVGLNVANNSYSVVFTFYNNGTAGQGTALWTETQTVTTADGIFRVALGSVTPIPANFNFNWDGLYLGIKVGADTEMTPRITMAAVPFAFNAQQVAGLTIQDSATGTAGSTSATLKIGTSATNPITVDLGLNNVTFNTGSYVNAQLLTITSSGTTSVTLPSSGTLLTNTATAVQTLTSTQTTGTVLGIADSTTQIGNVIGQTITLSGATGSLTQTGLQFNLSGATSGIAYDVQGTSNNWGITRAGALALAGVYGNNGDCLKSGGSGTTIMSWAACGGVAGGSSFWQELIGAISPLQLGDDFLIGGSATASADFAFTGLKGNQTQASFSGQFVLMPNNGYGGNASISGNLTIGAFGTSAIQTTNYQLLTLGGNTTGNILLNPKNSNAGLVYIGPSVTNAAFVFSQTDGGSPAKSMFTLGLAGTTNGGLTFNSSGASIAPATITTDANGNLILQTAQSSATVQIGSGNGNIGLALTNAADVLAASKTLTAAAGYSGLDFQFKRVITGGANSLTGAVLSVTDISSGTNTIAPDLILGNVALTSGTFTGNLLRLQVNGLDKFVVKSTGTTPVASISANTTFAAMIIDQSGTGDLFTASASGLPLFTIQKNGNIATIGTLTGLTGLTLASGSITLGGDTGNGLCLTGGTTAGWGSCGSGGGGTNYFGQTAGLTYIGNTTTDFAIGGNSTASADFIFGGINNPANGGVAIATFSGALMMNSQPNSSNFDQTNWQQISGTAGTLGGGATTQIASVSAMASYNGSLYVGTYKNPAGAAGSAEVYRYNGGSSWTLVSQATAGTIRSGDTSGIASISAMTVFDGYLFVGTSKMNSAEVYRYDGSTNWTKVSGPAAGTFGSSSALDGVASLAVYQGRMYAGIREPGAARLLRWEGGLTWTSINNNTTGTFVTTNTVGVHSVGPMVVKNGFLYLAAQKETDTDVLRYGGGTGTGASTTFLAMNTQSITGGYSINGAAATTGFSEVTAMTVYNGNVIVALRRANNQADILSLNDGLGTGVTNVDTWTRLNNAVGQMAPNGTSSIDSVTALTVYNGTLYAGTNESGNAEIYRYIGGDQKWLKVSQSTAGQLASGGTSGIYGVTILLPLNSDLYAGTNLGLKAEVYKLSNISLNKSYSIVFHTSPSVAGGEQSGNKETASIFYLASASANLGNSAADTGAFIFDHAIQTRNGSYDVAEDYPTRDDTLRPGDVVAIDPNERGFVKKTTQAYDYTALGVYSTNPALRLSQQDSAIDGGRIIPVALAGRVPVNVSTESGEIKPGDYLTPSSTPGVAMKATKSGGVIGQAMEGYVGDGVGQILVYIKSMTYNGSIADSFANFDTNVPNFAANVLADLKTNGTGGGQSSIVTDRLVAGLEIITPSVTTTTLTADTITAKIIRADRIEGLEIYTDHLSSLADAVASLQSLVGSQSAVLGVATGDATLTQISTPLSELTLINLSVDGLATISADLNVGGNGFIQGALNVLNDLTTKNLLVSQFAYFIQDVVFKGNVRFNATPTFNNDTAGFAVIQQGLDTVQVNFSQEYVNTPVVTASITLNKTGDSVSQKTLEDQILNGNISYVITQRTTKGFVVRLNKPAAEDINFSWVALSVQDAKTSGLNLDVTPQPAATNSAAFQSILNQLNGGGGN